MASGPKPKGTNPKGTKENSLINSSLGRWSRMTGHMVVSQNRGTQYRPQNTIIHIMKTPKTIPLILGNPNIQQARAFHLGKAKVYRAKRSGLTARVFSWRLEVWGLQFRVELTVWFWC